MGCPFMALWRLGAVMPNPGTGYLPKFEWHLKTFGRRHQLAREHGSNEGGFGAGTPMKVTVMLIK